MARSMARSSVGSSSGRETREGGYTSRQSTPNLTLRKPLQVAVCEFRDGAEKCEDFETNRERSYVDHTLSRSHTERIPTQPMTAY